MSEPVAILSTYAPQRCGIAGYSGRLARALTAIGHAPVILSERGAHDGMIGGVRSVPCFHRDDDYVASVLDAVDRVQPRLVHAQHAPDILGTDRRLPALLDGLRRRGVASVVTLHTVHNRWSAALERRFRARGFQRRLGQAADAVIVHGAGGMADMLTAQGVPGDKVHVIAHGTSPLDLPDRAASRERLGLPADGPLLLYFGFIHLQKNVHTLLRAMVRLRRLRPDAHLLVAGAVQPDAWYNRAYLRACRSYVAARRLGDRVTFRPGFVEPELVPSLYGAADLVLLPYNQSYGSASGVVHDALGAGRPLLCSTSPKFAEVAEHVSEDLRVPTFRARAWAERIAWLLGDDAARQARLQRMRTHATATSWPAIATRHQALYTRLAPDGGDGRRAAS